MPIVLYDKDSDRRLFEISEGDLAALDAALERDDAAESFYLDAAACDFLDGKLDTTLLDRLRGVVPGAATAAAAGDEAPDGVSEEVGDELPEVEGDAPGIEIVWRRE